MKYFRRCVLIASLVFLTRIQVYANDRATTQIFPTYTGISAKIIGKNINIRKYPNIYSNVITRVDQRNVRVVGQNDEWYRIILNNQEGWVYKPYVEIALADIVPYSKIMGEEIVDYGKQFLGTPYIWGGNDLKKGVDCSGLTKEIYKTFDIDISRVSYMQVKDGIRVSKSELIPGDLVFFDTSGKNRGKISHVGIYAGENRFLHADGTRGVMISSLTNPYYQRNYVAGARVIRI